MATQLFEQMPASRCGAFSIRVSAQTVTDLIAGRIQVMLRLANCRRADRTRQHKAFGFHASQARAHCAGPADDSEAALPATNTGVGSAFSHRRDGRAIIDRLSKASNEALADADVLRQLGTRDWRRARQRGRLPRFHQSRDRTMGAGDQINGLRKNESDARAAERGNVRGWSHAITRANLATHFDRLDHRRHDPELWDAHLLLVSVRNMLIN